MSPVKRFLMSTDMVLLVKEVRSEFFAQVVYLLVLSPYSSLFIRALFILGPPERFGSLVGDDQPYHQANKGYVEALC